MFLEITKELFDGFERTILLFIITLILAIPLGLLVALCSKSKFKPLAWLTDAIVWIFRGTPLLLQIIAITYIPLYVFGITNKQVMLGLGLSKMAYVSFVFVCIAFILNYAAYFSVIFKGGIQSIPKGQYEAGQVLGMKKSKIFFRIILPQVSKQILPPMSNEIITLVKDTSLAQVIGIAEIFFVANEIVSIKAIVWPIFYTGVFYLVFVGILTLLFNFIEKKMNYYKV